MKKILLAGALAASMLTSSAFASVLTVDYDKADNLVKVTDGINMADHAGKQMTVVVVSGDGDEVTTDTIRYIDQDEAEAGLFESMGVLLKDGETELPEGTYTVKIGGEGIGSENLYVGTLTVSYTPEGPTYTLGDVVVDGKINISDVTAALNAYLGNSTLTETQFLSADVAPKGAVDGRINISDVTLILNVYLGNDSF